MFDLRDALPAVIDSKGSNKHQAIYQNTNYFQNRHSQIKNHFFKASQFSWHEFILDKNLKQATGNANDVKAKKMLRAKLRSVTEKLSYKE